MNSHFLVFDLETTNNPDRNYRHEVIEIAVITINDGIINEKDSFHTLVRPPCRIQPRNFSVSGISDFMVEKAPTIDRVLPNLLRFLGDYPLVGHNIATFDIRVLNEQLSDFGHKPIPNIVLDTLILSKKLFQGEKKHDLDTIMKRLGIARCGEQRHRAMEDVKCTALAFLKLLEIVRGRNITTLEGINRFCNEDPKTTKEQQIKLF